MGRTRTCIAAGAAAAAMLAGAAAAAPSDPIRQVSISPGGDLLAYVAEREDRRRVLVYGLDGRIVASLGAGPQDIRDLKWVGPHHLLITASFADALPGSDTSRYYGVIAFDVKAQKFASLLGSSGEGPTGYRTQPKNRTTGVVISEPVAGEWSGRPTAFVTTLDLQGSCSFDLYRVELDGPGRRQHRKGTSGTREWAVTPQGAVLARSEHDAEGWRLLLNKGNNWEPLMPGQEPVLMGLGREPASLLVSMPVGEAEHRLVEVYADGRPAAQVSPDGAVAPAALHDESTGQLVGFVHGDEVKRHVFFRPELEAAWPHVQAIFPDRNVLLASWTPDFTKLVVLPDEADTSRYYLVDLTAKRADALAAASGGPEAAVKNDTFDISGEMRHQATEGFRNVKKVCGALRERGLPKTVRDRMSGQFRLTAEEFDMKMGKRK